MTGKKTPATLSRSPRRRRRAVEYALIAIACVVIVDALVGEKGLLAMIQAKREHRSLEQALADARAENDRLREHARRLREDPDAIEEIARGELGLIRPGERLFIIKDAGPAGSR